MKTRRLFRPSAAAGGFGNFGAWSTESTLYVITGRPAVWIPPAKSWLERHGIPVADIFSAATMGDKAQLAHQHGITLFVEDNASAALSIAQRGSTYCSWGTPRITDIVVLTRIFGG